MISIPKLSRTEVLATAVQQEQRGSEAIIQAVFKVEFQGFVTEIV